GQPDELHRRAGRRRSHQWPRAYSRGSAQVAARTCQRDPGFQERGGPRHGIPPGSQLNRSGTAPKERGARDSHSDAVSCAVATGGIMRDFEKPGRSTVMARHGMAATSHPLASLAAINVLQSGGNAMDAAIAACAVQGVVEPGSTGIGGDCFALYSKAGTDDIVAFNGSGWAPAAATPEKLQEQGVTQILRQSAHAVTVPGAVDAWSTLLNDHGTRPLAERPRPALRRAEEGFVAAPRAALGWQSQAGPLAAEPSAARAYRRGGKARAAAGLRRFPDMAATLRSIAGQGRDAF